MLEAASFSPESSTEISSPEQCGLCNGINDNINGNFCHKCIEDFYGPIDITVCRFCDKTFDTKEDIVRHISKIHHMDLETLHSQNAKNADLKKETPVKKEMPSGIKRKPMPLSKQKLLQAKLKENSVNAWLTSTPISMEKKQKMEDEEHDDLEKNDENTIEPETTTNIQVYRLGGSNPKYQNTIVTQSEKGWVSKFL